MTTVTIKAPVTGHDTSTAQYTVPALKTAILMAATVTNTHGSTQNATLSITPSGGSKTVIANNVAVATGAAANLLVTGVKQTLAAGDSVFIERGTSSTKAYMLKSATAVTAFTFPSNAQVAMAYGGTRLIALGQGTGSQASLATSDDSGVTWTVRGSSFGAIPNTIIGGLYSSSGVRYVFWGSSATGTQPALYHTYDGTALYRSSLNCPDAGITVNGSTFAILSGTSTGVPHTTTNGTDFSFGPTHPSALGTNVTHGKSIAYGASLYAACAVNTTGPAYSSDGLNWTSVAKTLAQNGRSMSFAGALFFLGEASGTELMTSPDALTWTARVVPSGTVSAVAYNGSNVYVAATAGGTSNWYSADAITWNTSTTTSINSNDVCFAASVFVGAGVGGQIFTSTDGNTWTSRTSNAGGNALNSICFGNSLFVAVGAAGTIVTSPTGTTWTARTSNTTGAIQQVAWNGTIFLALTQYGHLTSTDGVTWVARGANNNNTFSTGAITGVGSDGAGNFVVCNGATTFYKSTSYGIWTLVTPSPAATTNFPAYNGSRWTLAGSTSVCVTSTDFSTWAVPSTPIATAASLVSSGSTFYFTGTTGNIYKTTNPVTGWTDTGIAGGGLKLAALNSQVFTYNGGTTTGDSFSTDGFVSDVKAVITTSFTPTAPPVYVSGTSMLQITTGNVHTIDFPTATNSYLFSTALSLVEVS